MRRRYPSLSGSITNNPLAIGDTTLSSAALASLPAVAAPDYLAITLDPRGVAGVPEIVWVMAHTAAATSATIWRARENTVARQHLLATQWAHAPTPLDVIVNQNPWCYTPPGWDDNWIQAQYKAVTGGAPAWVLGHGMSIQSGGGTNITCARSKNYFRLVRDQMITTRGYPLYAEFFDAKQSANNGGTNLGWDVFWVQGADPSPWVFTAQPVWPGHGWNLVASKTAATNPNWTFTTRAGITGFDIIYWDQIAATAGDWTWHSPSVAADANQVVTTVASPGPGRAIQKRIHITGLAAGVHVITFSAQNAAGGPHIYIQGVAEFTSQTTGLGFVHSAYSGATLLISARTDAAVNPTDKMLAWQGNTKDAAPYDATFQFPTQPDLAIIEIGGNDTADPGVSGGAQGCGPQQFQSGLQRLIDALRRGQPYPNQISIVFVAISIPGPDSGSCDFTGASIDNPQTWPFYIRLIKQVAEEKECAFVNIHAKWGQTPLANGFCSATDFHATDAGHADIAAALGAIL